MMVRKLISKIGFLGLRVRDYYLVDHRFKFLLRSNYGIFLKADSEKSFNGEEVS